ncbi:MAG: hypothetical protein M1829_004224 [Trizodia sp. TS-e1964]|nr:MAG: hypothetical protein M1829_004224 [Trizodia sp. TS-e1964]
MKRIFIDDGTTTRSGKRRVLPFRKLSLPKRSAQHPSLSSPAVAWVSHPTDPDTFLALEPPSPQQHPSSPTPARSSLDDVPMLDATDLPGAPKPPLTPVARAPTPIYGHFARDADVDSPLVVQQQQQQQPQLHQQLHQYHAQSYAQSQLHRLPSPITEDYRLSLSPGAETESRMELDAAVGGALQGGGEAMIRGREGRGVGHGKTSFSMGYRAGCEKCRNRVPGHFNHVVRAL